MLWAAVRMDKIQRSEQNAQINVLYRSYRSVTAESWDTHVAIRVAEQRLKIINGIVSVA